MSKLKDIFSAEYEIKSYDIDFKQRLKLSTIFTFLQETAVKHVEGTPLGYNDLSDDSIFWVLTRIKIETNSFPKWNDKIKVNTWSKDANRMFAYRDFEIINGEEIISLATSDWILVDLETRKTHRLSELKEPVPKRDKHAIKEKLSKLSPQGEKVSSNIRKAVYSDIDIYNHVNNAKYIEWIMDTFSNEELKEYEVHSLQIHFINESKFDENIEINKYYNENEGYKVFYIEGINLSNNTKAYQAEIKFE